MAKSLPDNMCRQALIHGKLVPKGKDLLTEYEVCGKKLCIQNVTKGCINKNSIKKAIWEKNEKDLKTISCGYV